MDPERDLYAIEGFKREAVRTFLVQSIGLGHVAQHRMGNTDREVRKVPLPAVQEAVLRRFPSFKRMAEVVPADVGEHLSPPNRLRAVGLSGFICPTGRAWCWRSRWTVWRPRGSRRSRFMML